jgi:hypothetical protein
VQVAVDLEVLVPPPHRVVEVEELFASFSRKLGIALIRWASESRSRSKV